MCCFQDRLTTICFRLRTRALQKMQNEIDFEPFNTKWKRSQSIFLTRTQHQTPSCQLNSQLYVRCKPWQAVNRPNEPARKLPMLYICASRLVSAAESVNTALVTLGCTHPQPIKSARHRPDSDMHAREHPEVSCCRACLPQIPALIAWAPAGCQ